MNVWPGRSARTMDNLQAYGILHRVLTAKRAGGEVKLPTPPTSVADAEPIFSQDARAARKVVPSSAPGATIVLLRPQEGPRHDSSTSGVTLTTSEIPFKPRDDLFHQSRDSRKKTTMPASCHPSGRREKLVSIEITPRSTIVPWFHPAPNFHPP